MFLLLTEFDRQKKHKRSKPPPSESTKPPQTPTHDSRFRSQSTLSHKSRDDESADDATVVTAASPTKMRVTYEGMVAKEPTGLEDTPASVGVYKGYSISVWKTLIISYV